TQERIIAAAKTFLMSGDPKTDEWFGKAIFHEVASAGYRGMRLVLREDPQWITSRDEAFWGRWGPALISSYNEAEDADLLKLAYATASGRLLPLWRFLLERARQFGGELQASMEACWDPRIEHLALKRAEIAYATPG